jgi:hypothetical protein
MDARQAAGIVNTMAVRPGWTVEAVELDTSTIALLLSVDTYNSNERYAPDYAAGDAFAGSPDPCLVDVAGMDTVGLIGEVVRRCIAKDAHEWREFARYQDPATGRWIAPFHPHRPDGRANWNTGLASPLLADSA